MGKREGRWELATVKDFNIEFLQTLKTGQILGFMKNGEQVHWRVARIDKKRKHWWLQPWRVYTPDEFAELEKDRVPAHD
jgi:hypothetical protein